MKKILMSLLLCLLLAALCGCGAAQNGKQESAPTQAPAQATDAEAAPEETPAAEVEAAPAAEPETAPAETPAAEPEAAPAESGEEYALLFSTTDREGNAADQTILSGHALVILNFWEPWCPPCVAEMPDLEKLYEAYKDRGLLILGVYSETRMEDQADSVLAEAGTSYPILRYTEEFDVFQTGYVPTTVFLDSTGHVLGDVVVGSRSYEDWEALIKPWLP